MTTRSFFQVVGIPSLKALLVHKAVSAAMLGGVALVALHSLPLHFFWPSAAEMMLAAAIIPGLYFYRTARVGLLYPARIGQLLGIADWHRPATEPGHCPCVQNVLDSPEQLSRFKTLVEGTLLDLSGPPGAAARVQNVGPGLCFLSDALVASAISSSRGNVWVAARDILCAHVAEPEKPARMASTAGATHWTLGAIGFLGLWFLIATPLLTVEMLGFVLALFLSGAVAAYLTCLISSVGCAPLLSWELIKECQLAYAGRAAAPEQIGSLSARSANFREILTLAELDAAPDLPDGP